MNILEGCRHNKVAHLVYASSSSVYGSNTKIPFSEYDNTDHSVSLYAATKKSNELMAHKYSHLCGLPTTGLRFFTFYGPWGRPDMAPMIFSKAIIEGTPIDVRNHGDMKRDFTYIDDIVEGVECPRRLRRQIPNSTQQILIQIAATCITGFTILEFIETMENALGKRAIKNMKPMQAGDVQQTHAATVALHALVGFTPTTILVEGITQCAKCYVP